MRFIYGILMSYQFYLHAVLTQITLKTHYCKTRRQTLDKPYYINDSAVKHQTNFPHRNALNYSKCHFVSYLAASYFSVQSNNPLFRTARR